MVEARHPTLTVHNLTLDYLNQDDGYFIITWVNPSTDGVNPVLRTTVAIGRLTYKNNTMLYAEHTCDTHAWQKIKFSVAITSISTS